jgi:prolyl-tRNA synthetase
MFRAGMLRKLANGLFTYLPLGLRVFRKVERIIREEMDAIGCLEIRPPVITPGELWKESGRWETMGESMLRVRNRTGADFVVSPTNEEAVTGTIREELSSYKQLPLSVYQINTKYRDEIRPRYGVMRAREFTMKDAYSYHRDEDSLDNTYQAMGAAYRRIFKRCGLAVIPVKADSGAIGGSNSEEFMMESEIGDNTLLLCKSCGYAANVEKAGCQHEVYNPPQKNGGAGSLKMEKISTPHTRTIAELCEFLKTDARSFIKTLVYRAVNVERDLSGAAGCGSLKRRRFASGLPEVYEEAFFAVCIRGDLEVNEVKLAAVLKAADVRLADDADVVRITGAQVGFAGPVGLTAVPVLADPTVAAMTGAVTGALEADFHYAHVDAGRDWKPWLVADVRTVKAGDHCPVCGGELYEKKGNELGHIFKLGYKYTKAMNVRYLDENGVSQTPIMGTYGIGVDRTLASIIEKYHDDAGIIWPMEVAPFHVVIIPIKYEGKVKAVIDNIAMELAQFNIEFIIDDRDERPGVKFNDADLIGIPLRMVVGEKNLPRVEIKRRGEKDVSLVEISEAAGKITAMVNEKMKIKGGLY